MEKTLMTKESEMESENRERIKDAEWEQDKLSSYTPSPTVTHHMYIPTMAQKI